MSTLPQAPPRTLILALALLMIPAAASAGDWDWTLTPYVWFIDASASVTVADQEILGGSVDFNDLLDDTDGAFMVHLEGRGNRGGVFFDFVTLDLGDEPRIFGPLEGIEAESDLEITFIELGGIYYPGGEGSGFGIHYGGRLLDFDQEVDVLSIGGIGVDQRIVDASETFLDGLLGLRYDTKSDTGWSFAIWGDVAGGGTEFTWNAGTVFGYGWGASDQFALRVGWRYMDIEIEETGELSKYTTEIAASGPVLGFTFAF